MYRFFLPICMMGFLFFWSCNEEPSTPPQEEVTSEPETMTGKELLDKLKEEAVDPDDLLGRLEKSIIPLQEEFDKSSLVMQDLKEVKVMVSEDCQLTIENRANGILQTKVDLSKLDVNGLSLIPDLQEGEFPGIRVKTLNGEPLVEIYQEGQLVTRNNELVIMMAARPNIERIAPVLVQMIHLCQGTI